MEKIKDHLKVFDELLERMTYHNMDVSLMPIDDLLEDLEKRA